MEDAPFVKVGKAFAEHYYQLMQHCRANLEALYTDASCLTFENHAMQGKAAIMEKINSLTYQSVTHVITTIDCQPVMGVDNDLAVFVSVMGQLKTDEDIPQSFVQCFLLRNNKGNYYIANETFRLVVHNST